LLAVYAIAKFLAYSAWCYLGLRLLQPAAAHPTLALKLGGVRWFIGLFLGVGIFIFLHPIDANDAARLYVLIYSPVRLVEWGIMAFLIISRVRSERASGVAFPAFLWCLGGILVSFATDLLSPDGIQGRFCVGRCLC
jgi:hypothetical protein